MKTDSNLPYGKLSEYWGLAIVFVLIPISVTVLYAHLDDKSYSPDYVHKLLIVYLCAMIFNRIPIGYRWKKGFFYHIERVCFIFGFLTVLIMTIGLLDIPVIFWYMSSVIIFIWQAGKIITGLVDKSIRLPFFSRLSGVLFGALVESPILVLNILALVK